MFTMSVKIEIYTFTILEVVRSWVAIIDHVSADLQATACNLFRRIDAVKSYFCKSTAYLLSAYRHRIYYEVLEGWYRFTCRMTDTALTTGMTLMIALSNTLA